MTKHLTLLLFIGLAWGQNDTIAVFDFDNNGLSNYQIKQITLRLENELKRIAGFHLIERAKIDELVDSQLSDCDTECLSNIADLLNTNIFISGKVGKFDDSFYTISAELVDTKSGKILKSANYDASNGAELLQSALREISNNLFEVVEEETPNLENGAKYFITIDNVNFSSDDFRKDWLGSLFPITILLYENKNKVWEYTLKDPSNEIQKIDVSKRLVYNSNSIYLLRITDNPQPIMDIGNEYVIKSDKGDWMFDKGKIKVGKSSFISFSQIID